MTRLILFLLLLIIIMIFIGIIFIITLLCGNHVTLLIVPLVLDTIFIVMIARLAFKFK